MERYEEYLEGMCLHPGGSYVLYDDHVAEVEKLTNNAGEFSLNLMKQIEKLRAERDEARELVRDIRESFTLGFNCPEVSPSEVISCQRWKMDAAVKKWESEK